MNKTFCDIEGCKEEAIKEQIDTCLGWLESSSSYLNSDSFKYEPFEHPTIRKRDFCKKHLILWSKATYEAFFKIKGRNK